MSKKALHKEAKNNALSKQKQLLDIQKLNLNMMGIFKVILKHFSDESSDKVKQESLYLHLNMTKDKKICFSIYKLV